MWSYRESLVPPRGFEPLISALKGPRPRPLDDGGTHAPIVGHAVSASNRAAWRWPGYTRPCDGSSHHRRLLRQVEGGRRSVYCLFNNVFMMEDALRFQTLLAQAPEGRGSGGMRRDA